MNNHAANGFFAWEFMPNPHTHRFDLTLSRSVPFGAGGLPTLGPAVEAEKVAVPLPQVPARTSGPSIAINIDDYTLPEKSTWDGFVDGLRAGVRAIGNKTFSPTQWADVNSNNKIPGFKDMTAYQKGIELIGKDGFRKALRPTGQGLALSYATEGMPLAAHLPSVETVIIDVPASSASLYGIWNGLRTIQKPIYVNLDLYWEE